MAWSEGSVFSSLEGLGLKWEAISTVRERLKDLQCLMVEKPSPGEPEVKPVGAIAKTHSNLRHNATVMKPLLEMMAKHQEKTPCKEALCSELKILYEKSRLQADTTMLSEEAWSIRYMYGLVKQLTYKQKPPRETWIADWLLSTVFFYSNSFLIDKF